MKTKSLFALTLLGIWAISSTGLAQSFADNGALILDGYEYSTCRVTGADKKAEKSAVICTHDEMTPARICELQWNKKLETATVLIRSIDSSRKSQQIQELSSFEYENDFTVEKKSVEREALPALIKTWLREQCDNPRWNKIRATVKDYGPNLRCQRHVDVSAADGAYTNDSLTCFAKRKGTYIGVCKIERKKEIPGYRYTMMAMLEGRGETGNGSEDVRTTLQVQGKTAQEKNAKLDQELEKFVIEQCRTQEAKQKNPKSKNPLSAT